MPRFLHKHRSTELLSSLPGLGDLSKLSRSHSLRLSKRRRHDKDGKQKKTVARGLSELKESIGSGHPSHGNSSGPSDTERLLKAKGSSEKDLRAPQEQDLEQHEDSSERFGEFPVTGKPVKDWSRGNCTNQDERSDQHMISSGGSSESTASSDTVRRYPERAELPKLPTYKHEDIFGAVRAILNEATQSPFTSPPWIPEGSANDVQASGLNLRVDKGSVGSSDSRYRVSKPPSHDATPFNPPIRAESSLSWHTAAQALPASETDLLSFGSSEIMVVKSTYSHTDDWKTNAEERLLASLQQLGGSSSEDKSGHSPETTIGAESKDNLGNHGATTLLPEMTTSSGGNRLHALVQRFLRMDDSDSERGEHHLQSPQDLQAPKASVASAKRQWRNDHKNYFPPGSQGLPQDLVVGICNQYKKDMEKRLNKQSAGAQKRDPPP